MHINGLQVAATGSRLHADSHPGRRERPHTAWNLPDGWTPGSLPPAVAAPALLASAALLAAENKVTLSGIAWNPALLQVGEGRDISTETLPWHMDVDDAALVCRLFTAPLTRPLLLLLQAIRADPHGLCAARESARRRTGVRGAYRDARRQEEERLWESEAAQAEWQRRNPPDRFKLSRVLAAAAPADPIQRPPTRRRRWPYTSPSARTGRTTSWRHGPPVMARCCKIAMSVSGSRAIGIWTPHA